MLDAGQQASRLLTSGALLEQKHGRREMQYSMLLCTKPCYALLGRRTGNSSYVSMPLEVDRSIFSDSGYRLNGVRDSRCAPAFCCALIPCRGCGHVQEVQCGC
jgi:hypothetical protein